MKALPTLRISCGAAILIGAVAAVRAHAADLGAAMPATAPAAAPQPAVAPDSQALVLPANPAAAPTQPAGRERFLIDACFEDSGSVLTPTNAYDRHYTAGERVTLAYWPRWADDLAAAFPLHSQFEASQQGQPIKPQTAAGLVVGQDVYTPAHSSDPARHDAWPYAGWLYVGGFWQRASDLRLDHLEFDLGTTGQSTLAEDAQKFVHDTLGGAEPQGWDQQLPGEVGFNVLLSRRWDFDLYHNDDAWGLDLIPEAQMNLGTVNRNAALGGIVRYGWRMPHDFGVGTIHNASAYTTPTRQTGFYFFAGADGQYVQRDLFLDGPQFRSAPHPGSLPWVADGRTGLMLDLGKHWQISYQWTVLTFEMRGQRGYDGYGSVHVAYAFNW
jgi:hypothetical protein